MNHVRGGWLAFWIASMVASPIDPMISVWSFLRESVSNLIRFSLSWSRRLVNCAFQQSKSAWFLVQVARSSLTSFQYDAATPVAYFHAACSCSSRCAWAWCSRYRDRPNTPETQSKERVQTIVISSIEESPFLFTVRSGSDTSYGARKKSRKFHFLY